MRVTVDQHKCVSSGQSVLAAENVFDQREDDGVVVLLNDNPPAKSHGGVREAAVTCPAMAITVEE